MAEFATPLLDAVQAVPGVRGLWSRPNRARGSHFCRADLVLLVWAPGATAATRAAVIAAVSAHEGLLLVSVQLLERPPARAADRRLR